MSDDYELEAQAIIDGFTYELCSVCGRDIDAHTIAPDVLGHAHAYCHVNTEEV